MKHIARSCFFALLFFCLTAPVFCGEDISAYTAQKVDEFLDLHMRLTTYGSNAEALEAIDAFEAQFTAELPAVAVDAEQEQLIMDSLFLMERHHYRLDPKKNRAELRALMKAQMKRNEKYLDAHSKDGASKWLYLFTGDVTSYYMTRSVAATFRYGLHVKRLYEKALKIDPKLGNANINLGNWKFYAPGIVGGGLEKAGQQYRTALAGARTDQERYMSYVSLSQYCFEKKQLAQCAEYLQLADAINPGSKEIALVRRINQYGYSLFQYNRNQSGIDEEMSETEMDDDDR